MVITSSESPCERHLVDSRARPLVAASLDSDVSTVPVSIGLSSGAELLVGLLPSVIAMETRVFEARRVV